MLPLVAGMFSKTHRGKQQEFPPPPPCFLKTAPSAAGIMHLLRFALVKEVALVSVAFNDLMGTGERMGVGMGLQVTPVPLRDLPPCPLKSFLKSYHTKFLLQ